MTKLYMRTSSDLADPLSLERMLHEDYDLKGLGAKMN
jgi:hypothetical protein